MPIFPICSINCSCCRVRTPPLRTASSSWSAWTPAAANRGTAAERSPRSASLPVSGARCIQAAAGHAAARQATVHPGFRSPRRLNPCFSPVTHRAAGDALASLSLNNYVEMRHKTASRSWLLRKKLDNLMAALMPGTWIPQYSMVSAWWKHGMIEFLRVWGHRS
jgi:hypothetical protein